MAIRTTSLDQRCSLIVDCPHSTPEWTDGGVVVLRSQNIKNGCLDLSSPSYTTEEGYKDRTKRAAPLAGDLVITREAPMGEICRVPEGLRCCLGQRQVLIRPKCNSDYLHYAIQSPYVQKQIRGHDATGSTVSNLCIPDLKALRIPELPSESGIAKVLATLDAKIELNNRINAELEGMAKLLYDYWFVQFDFPMTAPQAAALGKPDLTGHPYRATGGKMIFCQEMKRNIPEGWRVGDLSELCSTVRGVTYSKSDVRGSTDENIIPILRATNVNNGVVDLSDLVFVTDDMPSEDQYLGKFDILIVMSSGSKAHVGKNALYHHHRKIAFGAFCSKIVAKKYCQIFVSVHLQADAFKKYISNVCLGTNINNLTNGHITGHRLVIPPQDQLIDFENMVTSFFEKIACNYQQNQELTQLRDWLLPILMNGQVTIK
jgi:type I restriction enzyme S subunit